MKGPHKDSSRMFVRVCVYVCVHKCLCGGVRVNFLF